MQNPIHPYAVTLAALIAVVGVRALLDPALGDTLPLVTVYGAVAVAVASGGYGPAVFATAAGYLACAYLFAPPRGSLGLDEVANQVGLAAYLSSCAVIIGIGQAMRSYHQAAERGRELLRVTIASVGDAVITTDSGGGITMLNPVAERLTGWSTRDAQGVPLATVFRVINETTRLAVDDPVSKVLEHGCVVGLANHTLLVARDGSERPIDDSASPIRSETGDIVGCILVFRDVTEQRRLERDNASRLAAARLLAAIVESSDDAIVSKSLDGVVQTWNAAAERLFGYAAADAIGRHISFIIPADRGTEEEGIVSRIRAGQRIEHFDTVRQRRDGTLVAVSLTISPIRNEVGEVIGASKIARDITDRKRIEERLAGFQADSARELTRMSRLQALGGRIAAIDDLHAVMKEILAASAELTGTDKGNIQLVVPETGALRIVVHQGLGARLLEHFADNGWSATCDAALKQGRRVIVEDVSCEPTVQGTLGLEIILEDGIRAIQSTPLISRSGRVLGMLNNHFRQTHRPSDSDLRFLDLLARMTADLVERAQAEHELRESDRRKDEFLAILAHELRNPLAPIRNAVHLMGLTHIRDEDRATFAMLDRQVAQMVRLVDDLLDVSRISRDKMKLQIERVELASVLHHAVEAVRPMCEDMDQRLTLSLPGNPLYLDADSARLAQVVGNLLSNACKFTGRGGHVALTADREGDRVVIRVRDDGIGIAAEHLPRVFEMFTQLDTSLERTKGGLGLGLTLVRNLVEMHGGSVAAHSEGVGHGAEFIVHLPIADDGHPSVTAPPPDAPLPMARRRILVVDDNRDSADSLATLLTMTGHDVHTAYDGQEAVAEAESYRPDVVLLDLGLPTLNGYEAARRIRAESWGRNMLLVALTGWGQDEDRQRSKAAGFNRHMVKPVEYAALMKLLAESHAA